MPPHSYVCRKEKERKSVSDNMKKFSKKITLPAFVVLAATLAPVSLALLVFAFRLSDADALEIYIKYTKMLEYIIAALLLSVGGGLLTDYIFRSSK